VKVRPALALLPALAIAACAGDAREPSPPGYGEPSSSVLSGDGTNMELVLAYNTERGPSARHRPSHVACSNDHPYDFCFEDGECTTGGPCLCGGRVDSYTWNICLDGDCMVDADCGEGGRCSPTRGHCSSIILGQYCRTPDDECRDDTDCLSGVSCKYVVERARWACDDNNDCPIY
jgi:hypothetical protein